MRIYCHENASMNDAELAPVQKRKGRSVALYVKDCISFSVRKDLFYNNDNIETAFIEVDLGHLGTSNKSYNRDYISTTRQRHGPV